MCVTEAKNENTRPTNLWSVNSNEVYSLEFLSFIQPKGNDENQLFSSNSIRIKQTIQIHRNILFRWLGWIEGIIWTGIVASVEIVANRDEVNEISVKITENGWYD